MKKNIFSLVAILFSAQVSFAGIYDQIPSDDVPAPRPASNLGTSTTPNYQAPAGAGGDVAPSYQMPTGVTAKPNETIQDAAQKSSKNNGAGQALGMAAIGVTAAGVVSTCGSGFGVGACPYWLAGLAASTVVTANMMKAKNESNKTLAAVTVGNGASAGGGDPTPTYGGSPQMQQAQDLLNQAKKAGYKIDPNTGNVTDPKGRTYNAGMLGNSSAMQAAGMSSSEINSALGVSKKMQAAIDKAAAKGADATSDMFGDSIGGGGAGTAAVKGAEGTALDGSTSGYRAGVLGNEGRDPAAVAGLQKNLDGTPIGISQDNLFTMIGKRYQWCSDRGCFLQTSKP